VEDEDWSARVGSVGVWEVDEGRVVEDSVFGFELQSSHGS
jgi:hypothetical protein